MTTSAIQQINAILGQLTAAQRVAVAKYVDLSQVNIMSLSEKDAQVLLLRLKAAVATTTNPIKEGMNERQAQLDAKKANATSVWEDARKAYYTQLAVLHSDETKENQTKADDLFLEMQLAGEHMVDATKRANNNAISNIWSGLA